jgi:hypothetical protein
MLDIVIGTLAVIGGLSLTVWAGFSVLMYCVWKGW